MIGAERRCWVKLQVLWVRGMQLIRRRKLYPHPPIPMVILNQLTLLAGLNSAVGRSSFFYLLVLLYFHSNCKCSLVGGDISNINFIHKNQSPVRPMYGWLYVHYVWSVRRTPPASRPPRTCPVAGTEHPGS